MQINLYKDKKNTAETYLLTSDLSEIKEVCTETPPKSKVTVY
jgi:hypothetical protein